MNNSMVMVGRTAGMLGVALSAGSGIARLAGFHWIGKFETLTILQAGIAGIALGCFCLLLALTKDFGKR